MTPQERELLTNLVARLKQAPPTETDEEAAAMIRDLVRDQPDAPYLLAQTVLIQDYALHQAQSRIAELERQAQPQRSAGGGGSFLGAIFGSAASSRPQPAPQALAPAYTQAPPSYAQAQPGPWGGGGGPFAQSSGPSFLRSAAATAAGVAGGALLFQGIESLFGAGHGLGGFGSTAPGLTETVVNNYYGDAVPGADNPDVRDADAVPADDQGVQDADYQDDGSQDFGGDDFGGGGDDTVGV